MQKPRYFLRADGNAHIGLGHLSRCMALADRLGAFGQVHFLLSASSAEAALRLGLSQQLLVPESFSFDTACALVTQLNPGDWVVIDHYALNQAYLDGLKAADIGTIQINDLPEQALAPYALLNHCPNLTPQDFPSEKTKPKHWLLGLEWLLLRSPYPSLIANPPEKGDGLFLCFGGTASGGQLQKCLQWLHDSNYSSPVRVICPSPAEAAFVAKRFPMLKISAFSQQASHAMATLMRASAVAIVPSSTLALEALAAGVPLLTGTTAQNQKFLAQSLKAFLGVIQLGPWDNVGPQDFLAALSRLSHGASSPPRPLPKPWQAFPNWLKIPYDPIA